MAGFQGERHQQKRAVQPSQSLQDYWKRPHVITPSLWGETMLPEVQGGSTTRSESDQLQPGRRRRAGKAADTTERMYERDIQDNTQELRERIQLYGVNTLSNPELLEVILRTGQASETTVRKVQQVLLDHSFAQLLQAEFGELCNTYQLGESRTAQLQAVGEYARRLTLPARETPHAIKSPEDAVALVRADMEHLDHEEMRVLLLNTKNQVVANQQLYKGTVHTSVLRGGEVFRAAVTRNCAGILVFHNHPSGDPTQSPEDITATEQLVQAGKVLDIELVDHIIIGKQNRFVSLREHIRW